MNDASGSRRRPLRPRRSRRRARWPARDPPQPDRSRTAARCRTNHESARPARAARHSDIRHRPIRQQLAQEPTSLNVALHKHADAGLGRGSEHLRTQSGSLGRVLMSRRPQPVAPELDGQPEVQELILPGCSEPRDHAVVLDHAAVDTARRDLFRPTPCDGIAREAVWTSSTSGTSATVIGLAHRCLGGSRGRHSLAAPWDTGGTRHDRSDVFRLLERDHRTRV